VAAIGLLMCGGVLPTLKEGRNMAKLFVGSLPFNVTDERLLHLFSEKGYRPISARVITDFETGRSRGFGFVELEPGDDAARAIGEFDGLNIEGRMLHVSEARPQESRGGGQFGRRGRQRF
jgi:RNA recognition motif-containing protein